MLVFSTDGENNTGNERWKCEDVGVMNLRDWEGVTTDEGSRENVGKY